jgi:hypothetical protein
MPPPPFHLLAAQGGRSDKSAGRRARKLVMLATGARTNRRANQPNNRPDHTAAATKFQELNESEPETGATRRRRAARRRVAANLKYLTVLI